MCVISWTRKTGKKKRCWGEASSVLESGCGGGGGKNEEFSQMGAEELSCDFFGEFIESFFGGVYSISVIEVFG